MTRAWLVSQQDVLVRSVAMPLNTNWENSGGAGRRRASLMAQWGKMNPPANAGDPEDAGQIPELGKPNG